MNPVLRLSLIATGTIAMIFAAMIMLRTCSSTVTYEKKSNPILNEPAPEGNPQKLILVAQEGGSGENPENTFKAFDEAQSLGCWLQFDVRTTSDGQPIVMSDLTLDRTTDGRGYVNQHTLAEIQRLHAGIEFTPKPTEPLVVPTFEQMLDRYKNSTLVVSIKDNDPMAVQKIVDLVTAKNMQDKIIFASSNPSVIAEVRRLRPTWLTVSTPDERDRMVMLSSMKLQGIAIVDGDFVISETQMGSIRYLTEPIITELHRRFKKVLAMNVSSKREAEEDFQLHVDGFTTAKPKLLRGIISSMPNGLAK